MSSAPVSQFETAASRHATYIDELHELFTARSLAYGAAEDLAPFALRLDDPTFHEEMSSMVRSILYREDPPPSRAELCELLAGAVGGNQVQQTRTDLTRPLRYLRDFIAEVLGTQRQPFVSSSEEAVPSLYTNPVVDFPEPDRHATIATVSHQPSAETPIETSKVHRFTKDSLLLLLTLLVIVLAAILLREKTRTPPPQTAISPTPQPASVQRNAKPSAWGTPLRMRHQPSLPSVAHAQSTPRILPTSRPSQRRTGSPSRLEGRPSPMASQGTVFMTSSGAMASQLLYAPAPAYPSVARVAQVEGVVTLQVVVGPTGAVQATRLLKGSSLLRDAAEVAVRQWRYAPYVVGGQPTAVSTLVSFNFRLQP